VGARHMTREQRQMARRLKSKGLTLKAIARELSCSLPLVTASVYVQHPESGLPDRWTPAPGRLSAEDREEILLGLARGESMSAIARSLGRAPSTITREVAANGGTRRYGAWRAHCRAEGSLRRPKPAKLAHPPLVRQVTTWLEKLWSPQEIAARLRLEYPDDPMMQVSHETIYQSLFVQGRGELRRELARCLRSGRTARRHQGRVETRGKNPNMVMISERPAEIEDRAVPGHWEGDLIIGSANKSAVGTLVERSTRFVLLLHLPDGYGRCTSRELCARPSRSCPTSSRAPSLGTRAMRWQAMWTSPWPPASPSTSAIRIRHGNGGAMRIRTDCCANTCQRAPTSQCKRRRPCSISAKPQRTPSQDARIYETIREVCRARCAHRLKPPTVRLWTEATAGVLRSNTVGSVARRAVDVCLGNQGPDHQPSVGAFGAFVRLSESYMHRIGSRTAIHETMGTSYRADVPVKSRLRGSERVANESQFGRALVEMVRDLVAER
jgi:IS30 family transposase